MNLYDRICAYLFIFTFFFVLIAILTNIPYIIDTVKGALAIFMGRMP